MTLDQLVEYIGGPGAQYKWLPYTSRVVVSGPNGPILFGTGPTERAALLSLAIERSHK